MDKELIDFYLLIKKYELYKGVKDKDFACIYNNTLFTFTKKIEKQEVCIGCPAKKYNSDKFCQEIVHGNLRALIKMFPSLILKEGKDSL